jgi:site-specific DNA recombinase
MADRNSKGLTQNRAALYARFSTDKQSSTDDQLRVCARIAEGAGFEVVRSFTDEALSGGTAKRPGYQAMLAFIRDGQADVIVAEDSSRLWRNLAEQSPRLAELRDLGVHVVTHDLDTRQESSIWVGPILGTAAEAYRKEIGRRTRRGLEGRALDRKPTGGRAYGYISATASGTGQVEINSGEAEIVRRIFHDYADGKSSREIAAALNSEGVPSPGASWNRNGADAGGKRRDGKWQSTAIHGHAHSAARAFSSIPDTSAAFSGDACAGTVAPPTAADGRRS